MFVIVDIQHVSITCRPTVLHPAELIFSIKTGFQLLWEPVKTVKI